MNTASLEPGLLLLGEPPYSAAKASELLELASSRETVCSAADLTRLDRRTQWLQPGAMPRWRSVGLPGWNRRAATAAAGCARQPAVLHVLAQSDPLGSVSRKP